MRIRPASFAAKASENSSQSAALPLSHMGERWWPPEWGSVVTAFSPPSRANLLIVQLLTGLVRGSRRVRSAVHSPLFHCGWKGYGETIPMLRPLHVPQIRGHKGVRHWVGVPPIIAYGVGKSTAVMSKGASQHWGKHKCTSGGIQATVSLLSNCLQMKWCFSLSLTPRFWAVGPIRPSLVRGLRPRNAPPKPCHASSTGCRYS